MDKNKRVAIIISVFWLIFIYTDTIYGGSNGLEKLFILSSSVFIYGLLNLLKILRSMSALIYSLISCLLLLSPVNAGYDEEYMMGTLMAYSVYCEEMTDKGVDSFTIYVLDNVGSIEGLDNSAAYKAAYNILALGAEPEDFRPTACNQYKKALKRKDFYWVFEK